MSDLVSKSTLFEGIILRFIVGFSSSMREQRPITNFYAGYSSVYYNMQHVHTQSSGTYHIPYQLHSQQFWIAL